MASCKTSSSYLMVSQVVFSMVKIIHLVMSGWFLTINVIMMNSCSNVTNSNAKVTKSITKGTKSIAKLTNSIANGTNYTARVTNSTANRTKSIAKATNLFAKSCNQTHCLHALLEAALKPG